MTKYSIPIDYDETPLTRVDFVVLETPSPPITYDWEFDEDNPPTEFTKKVCEYLVEQKNAELENDWVEVIMLLGKEDERIFVELNNGKDVMFDLFNKSEMLRILSTKHRIEYMFRSFYKWMKKIFLLK